MTTHLFKFPAPISEMRTRCGVYLTGDKKPESLEGHCVGYDNALVHVDCAGCLRDMIVETRIKSSGFEDTRETRWLFGGDTGNSSVVIWSVMTGVSQIMMRRDFDVPHDPDDFGRCHRLLNEFPEWRARMPEVGQRESEWTKIVAAWEELTALYEEEAPTGKAPKLYARLKELGG